MKKFLPSLCLTLVGLASALGHGAAKAIERSYCLATVGAEQVGCSTGIVRGSFLADVEWSGHVSFTGAPGYGRRAQVEMYIYRVTRNGVVRVNQSSFTAHEFGQRRGSGAHAILQAGGARYYMTGFATPNNLFSVTGAFNICTTRSRIGVIGNPVCAAAA